MMRQLFPNLINSPVEASAATEIIAKVNMTFCSPTFATHGVNAKIKMVEMMLRVNVTPTTASAMIFDTVSTGSSRSQTRRLTSVYASVRYVKATLDMGGMANENIPMPTATMGQLMPWPRAKPNIIRPIVYRQYDTHMCDVIEGTYRQGRRARKQATARDASRAHRHRCSCARATRSYDH